MTVITLSRQIGSGGNEIARAVADQLGLRLIGREIVNQAARRSGAPELALAQIDELGLLGLKPCAGDCQRYAATVTEIMRDWAAQGSVLLLGRGGQIALAGVPGVLRVRVIAPLAQRVARVAERYHLPEQIARAQVEARDRARAAYLQTYFGCDPANAELYDLILNTAYVSYTATAHIICQAAAQIPIAEVVA